MSLNLAELQARLELETKSVSTPESLETFKRDWMGKDGAVKVLFKQLKDVPASDKPKVAADLNQLKERVEAFIVERANDFANAGDNKRIAQEFFDFSLPGKNPGIGSAHPIRLVERRLEDLLRPFGCRVIEGPEVETQYYCFDALNIPKHHPARDMQDTFYIDQEDGLGLLHVLRTHTTSVQARELQKGQLPVKVMSYGRVYRNETEDASHQAMFHQFEVVWIEPGLTVSHLMGILSYLLKGLYGQERRVRFVPKFYPYTEPSLGAQVDCTICAAKGCGACGGAGWVTILGSGMIHRNVLTEFNYDPEKVSGFAFGMGTSRLAAQFYNSPTLKTLYDGDLRVFATL